MKTNLLNNLEKKRHSIAHIMAMAVLEIYPKAKLGIGPVIENGFYYDFDLPMSLTPDKLKEIEKRMKDLIKKDLQFKKEVITFAKAKTIFKNEPYKLELIKELNKEKKKITIYTTTNVGHRKSYIQPFQDLCSGPHIKSTNEINFQAFKLTRLAGAYWKGDENNKMLTRIYGVAFDNEKDLEKHLELIKEAEKRDHRKLGKELDLFTFSDLVGKGLPLWTEKGAIIRREIEKFITDEEIKRGYTHVITPDIANIKLYETSGHYPYYKDSMYPPMEIDEEKLILRPMSCPHHFVLYQNKIRSYKDLPIKIAELAKLYRYERSGELTGLIRVRNFCLADSHIFTTEDRAEKAINDVLDLIEYANGVLGFKKGSDYTYRLSLGDRKNSKKYYKNDKAWNKGEKILRSALKKRKEDFVEEKDDAAFYGPKIDIQIKNVLGKEDTAFTVQYDFCLPDKFNLKYIDKDGKEKRPIVIHRSSVGAIERTIAFMIEKYAGSFPVWLSPVQALIIPVSRKFNKYGDKVLNVLKNYNIRAEIDNSDETLGKKIRLGEKQKISYLLIVGEKEMKNKTVGVRIRKKGDIGEMKIEKLLEKITKEIQNKK